MTLSEQARERLADIVELQPTKNAELQECWDMESGSEVHQYLESHLGNYYYRDDDSLICATPEAQALVDGETQNGDRTVRGSTLQRRILDALPAPDEEPQSVVATLQAVRETGEDPSVEEVRKGIHGLEDRGLVERVHRTVPTFRLAIDRERVHVETSG